MKTNTGEPSRSDLQKGHLVVSIIRAQEEVDRAHAECPRKEHTDYGQREEIACRKKVRELQRKADCLMRKYERLKRAEKRRDRSWSDPD